MDFSPTEHSHVRYNPLKGEWILVSPHRMRRPWSGQIEDIPPEEVPQCDLSNPLCPGALRANNERNPMYTSTFTFNNDFPAMLEHAPDPPASDNPLFQMAAARGVCKVMCFHPRTDITVALMSVDELVAVINGWIAEFDNLKCKYTWIQIFENRGAMVGCSNPHPHCQIWASSFFPNEPRIKDSYMKEYYNKYKEPMLLSYVRQELCKKERIIASNGDFVALVPFWAVWPYEAMIIPTSHILRITDLSEQQKTSLANIVKILTTKYDNLFHTSFPYTMGWHGAPTGEKLKEDFNHWVFHGIYYPPLLRSATIKKFMVGYEMLAQAQRDITPEQAAAKLRGLPDVHYKNA